MPSTLVPALVRVALALGVLGLIVPACAPDRHRITPTTLGSDLRLLPRGRMTPRPFPGTDLTRRSGPATVDPAAALASGSSRADAVR